MRKFVFVLGPTASGKSDLALRLAEKTQGVILNCDSVQLYEKVQIGAAKPTPQDMKRVPHHLFGIVTPPDEITSAGYRRLFLQKLMEIPEEQTVFVVGGTGFYFLALEKGLYEIQEASEDLKRQIHQELQHLSGPENLLMEVKKQDPVYAAKLHLNDTYRISRAVEILRSNPGKTITDLIKEKENTTGLPGRIVKMGLKWPAPVLEDRIRQRARHMLQAGLVAETQDLMAEGLKDWAPLRSVGYKETVQFLEGEWPESELEEKIVISTRQLAKKQRTWFQRDSEILWLPDLSEASYQQAFKALG